MCRWESPVDENCADPCPACLGYPIATDGTPAPGYPANQTFTAWAVYSRPITTWPAQNVATRLTGVDENSAAIGPDDEIIVQGAELLYSSKVGRYPIVTLGKQLLKL